MKRNEAKTSPGGIKCGTWMNVEQVAEYMGVTILTINRWTHSKGLPAHKISSKVVWYDRAEINEWIKSKKA